MLWSKKAFNSTVIEVSKKIKLFCDLDYVRDNLKSNLTNLSNFVIFLTKIQSLLSEFLTKASLCFRPQALYVSPARYARKFVNYITNSYSSFIKKYEGNYRLWVGRDNLEESSRTLKN